MFRKEKKFLRWPRALWARNVPLGAGIALPTKITRAIDNVTFTYFGDGPRTKAVYETSIWRRFWKLPVIFIIEKQPIRHGQPPPATLHSSAENLGTWQGFRIPGERWTAWTCLQSRKQANAPVKHCRFGRRPYILEIKTYRYRGHFYVDPAKIPHREEVQKMAR